MLIRHKHTLLTNLSWFVQLCFIHVLGILGNFEKAELTELFSLRFIYFLKALREDKVLEIKKKILGENDC